MCAMPRIVLTRHIAPDAERELARFGELTIWQDDRPIPSEVLEQWTADADACLSMLTDRIDDHILGQAPHLRIIANMAVGYDNIDVEAATRHGVMITNTPDVLNEATAELSWALMLALMRNMVPARQAMLDGDWKTWSPNGFLGTEVSGKTLGIVGLGRIGRSVARRASAFNMPVIGWQSGHSLLTDNIPRLSRDDFLAQSDIISVHLPLTSETRGLINQSWFDRMKPTAFLINTARGPIIDEDALLAALNTGRLAGAGLDVFDREPVDPSHPLIHHPHVLATPHVGSATVETRRAMALRAAANVCAALNGNPPPDWVNRAQ